MSDTRIFLIPTFLGNEKVNRAIPQYNIKVLSEIDVFVVENEKSARKFIKTLLPEKPQSELEIHLLNKKTTESEFVELSKILDSGKQIGVLSEAGLPAVADPGAKLVRLAHQKKIRVIPLVGASSLLMALMASGLNGQNFAFSGYLPIDKNERKKAIINLEKESFQKKAAQIFMETPYRNNQLLSDLKEFCSPETQLCVACNITLDDEQIITMTIKEWRQKKADFHKKPAIFIIES